MLDQPGLDLGQVAQQSGFSSRKYFGDRFKSRYGMTPSEFRAARQ
jgi:AraC-like DNA-binding protein